MFVVNFALPYKSIPAGFSFEFDGAIRLNNIVFDIDTLISLAELDIVTLDEKFTWSEEVSATPTMNTSRFVCHLVGENRDKITTAVVEDIDNNKFSYGAEYKFYDVENREWKVSRLKKTGSHIGRITSGFAVPVDASAKKMFNRLEKLNVMYDLGLTREDCRVITNYYN